MAVAAMDERWEGARDSRRGVRARGSFSNNSRRYQYGSHPFALAVSIKLYSSALAAAGFKPPK